MNILITDYYSASNRGDAAIFEGVYRSLKDVYPDAEFTVMTEHPEAAELIHGIEAVDQVLAGFRWELSQINMARLYLSLTAPAINQGIELPGLEFIKRQGNVQPYIDADLVVSTGGQFLTDIYFPDKLGTLWQHYFLSQLDTPVVIYAQTLGPFDRTPYRQLTKLALDSTELIITRDKRSKEIVEELGVSTPVHFTADAAFSMDVEENRSTLLDILKTNDTLPKDEKPLVSISIREWQHTDSSTATDNHMSVIADVADWLVEEQQTNVVFASTCTGVAGYHKDDRLTAARVVDRMEHGDRDAVQILTGEYTPRQLVRLYEQVDLHIGMRMHSCILAMMAETPVVAIQYQFKTRGLMSQFGLSNYMIDINEMNWESLQKLVDEALANRSTIVDLIKSELPNICNESQRSAQLVREQLARGNRA